LFEKITSAIGLLENALEEGLMMKLKFLIEKISCFYHLLQVKAASLWNLRETQIRHLFLEITQ
jgi:hypothetical protein